MPKPVVWMIVIAVGLAAYVVGAKAGRSRYREISSTVDKFWNDPAVKKARTRTLKRMEKAAHKAAGKISR